MLLVATRICRSTEYTIKVNIETNGEIPDVKSVTLDNAVKKYEDGTIVRPDGTVLGTLQPGDQMYDYIQKFNAYFANMGNDINAIAAPVNTIQKDMEQAVQTLNAISNMNNSDNRVQNITQEFHITMPNVNDSAKATELMRDLQTLGTKKIQFFDSRS